MPEIDMDEFGRFWVFTDERPDEPYAGPYDTQEAALEAHHEAAP